MNRDFRYIVRLLFNCESERDKVCDALKILKSLKNNMSSAFENQATQAIDLLMKVQLLEINDYSRIFEKNLGTNKIPPPPVDYDFASNHR